MAETALGPAGDRPPPPAARPGSRSRPLPGPEPALGTRAGYRPRHRQGRTDQEIAAGLFISRSTVKARITRIQGQLGIRNRAGIAAWAWGNRVREGCPLTSPRP